MKIERKLHRPRPQKTLIFCLAFLGLGFVFTGLAQNSSAAERAEIIYESGGRVMSIDSDGAGRVNLTPDRIAEDRLFDEGVAPDISRDGTRIAWIDPTEPPEGRPFQRLMVARRDGSEPTAILSTRGRPKRVLTGISWAPNGRLFFVEYIGGSRKDPRFITRIVSLSADGSGRRIEVTRSFVRKKSWKGSGGFINAVEVSPDGKKLLLETFDFTYGDPQLDIFTPATGKSRILRRHAEDGAWSPDGGRIIFTATRVGKKKISPKLYVMNLKQGKARKLTSSKGRTIESDGSWSPDGSRIAFASNRNAPDSPYVGKEIYTIGTDGSCLTWLTNGTPAAMNPQWGPEIDRDAAPVTCGHTDRQPVVDLVPDPTPIVNGEPTEWPQLWLGPSFRGLGQAMTPGDGRSLEYSDCLSFNRSDCSRVAYTVSSDDVCLRWAEQFASDGQFGQVKMIRGALAFLPNPKRSGAENSLVLTGGQAVMISGALAPFGPGTFVSDHLDAIDRLQKVGGDPSETLQAPVVSGSLGFMSNRYSAAVKKSGSVAAAAKKMGERQGVVRGWLRINRALKQYGPFKTVSCKGWL